MPVDPEPLPPPAPDPQLEPDPDPIEPQPDLSAAIEPGPEPEEVPDHEPLAAVEPHPEPEADIDPEPDLEPEPEPDLEPDLEPEPEPEPVLRRKPDLEPARPRPVRPPPRPAPPRRAAPSPRPAPALRRRTRQPQPIPRRQIPRRSSGPGARVGRRLLAGAALVVVIGAVYLGLQTFQPLHGDPRGLVQVTVPPGSDAGTIGKLLADRGVVDNGTYFSLNATVTGRRGNLRSGDYTLQRGMSYSAALDALTKGPKAKVIKTFSFTLPEGLSVRESAPLVAKGGIEGDYVKAAKAAPALRKARALGLPRANENPEGFLFPATYDLVSGASAADLVDKQLAAFKDNFSGIGLSRAKRANLTRYDVITIASMIEREAQVDRERPLISAVIYNRLKQGMTLSIDATIRYAENNWTEPLKQSELDRPGPYNLRLNRGLPPTPIGNPGQASLKAAANPASTGFLYYVVKPGTCGRHAFSETEAGFEAAVARYNAAREQAGGKSPTTC